MARKPKKEKPTGEHKPLRDEKGRLLPGQTANPHGVSSHEVMVKRRIKKLMADNAPRAMERLMEIVEDPDPKTAIVAVKYLLDHVVGKPAPDIAEDQQQRPTVLVIDGFEVRPRERPEAATEEARA